MEMNGDELLIKRLRQSDSRNRSAQAAVKVNADDEQEKAVGFQANVGDRVNEGRVPRAEGGVTEEAEIVYRVRAKRKQ